MWQWILAVAAVVLCTGSGWRLAGQYRARVQELTAAVAFLTQLGSRLRFAPLPTRTLFEELEEQSDLPFVAGTAKNLQEDPCFPAVWSAQLQAARGNLSLREEDYRVLEKLGDLLGSGDAQGTAEGIGLLTEQLRDRCREAAEQARTDGKLIRSLGLFTGLAVAILLM